MIRGMDRAGVAILETTAQGRLVKGFTFPLPRAFPQSSQASEFVMVAQARRLLTRKGIIHSDCLNVVRAAAGPLRRALAPARTYAGVNLDKLQMAEHDKLVEEVVWVKSHRTIYGTEGVGELRDIRGNAEADRLAKAAVKAHDQPTALQRANLEYYVRRAPHVAKAIATALAAFPPSEAERLKRAAAPRSAHEAEQRQLHWWKHEGGNWRCQVCGTWATCDSIDERHRTERCRGPRAEAEAKTWVGFGHRISVAKGTVPIAFCTKCGAWGNRRALKLRAACAAPTAAGVAALKNIIAGKYPWQSRLRQGGCAPRARLRIVATYVEDKDAWMPVSAEAGGQGREAAAEPRAHRAEVGPGSEEVRNAASAQSVSDMDGITADPVGWISDGEDPFGHGGGLDEDDGDRGDRGVFPVGSNDRGGLHEQRHAAVESTSGQGSVAVHGRGQTRGPGQAGLEAGPSAKERLQAIRDRVRARLRGSGESGTVAALRRR